MVKDGSGQKEPPNRVAVGQGFEETPSPCHVTHQN